MSETITLGSKEMPEELSRMLGDLIRSKLGGSSSERPPIAEQAAKLLDLRERYEHRGDLQVGTLVRFKDGLGSMKESVRAKIVMMLWRMLDAKDDVDNALAIKWLEEHNVSGRPDCVVAYVCDDGHCLVQIVADSGELEPYQTPAN